MVDKVDEVDNEFNKVEEDVNEDDKTDEVKDVKVEDIVVKVG